MFVVGVRLLNHRSLPNDFSDPLNQIRRDLATKVSSGRSALVDVEGFSAFVQQISQFIIPREGLICAMT